MRFYKTDVFLEESFTEIEPDFSTTSCLHSTLIHDIQVADFLSDAGAATFAEPLFTQELLWAAKKKSQPQFHLHTGYDFLAVHGRDANYSPCLTVM